jgi:hypothetical protein
MHKITGGYDKVSSRILELVINKKFTEGNETNNYKKGNSVFQRNEKKKLDLKKYYKVHIYIIEL